MSAQGKLTLFATAAGDYAADLVVDVRADKGSVNLRNLRTGAQEQLTADPGLAQPAVSADSVAWWDGSGGQAGSLAWRRTAGGNVATLPVPAPVQHVAVDGTRVAFLLVDGTLGLWDAETGEAKSLATLPALKKQLPFPVPPGGLAMSNGRIAAIVFNGSISDWALVVFDLDGNGAIVSDKASPFGVTMNGDMLIWAENVGLESGKVASSSGTEILDTDIEGYSFRTNTFYRIFPLRGQQGFPSFDGDRLARQDSALGGNDIFTVRLPPNL